MSPRQRGPRFDAEDLEITPLDHAETITPGERTRRDLFETETRAFNKDLAEAYDRQWQTSLKAGLVSPDDEVSTDAVTSAQQAVDGWLVRWTFAVQDGQLVVRSVQLEPEDRTTPPGGLTSETLRGLSPFRAITAVAPEYLDRLDDRSEFLSLVTRWRTEDVEQSGSSGISKGKGGRPRLPDDLLRNVAIAYLDELPKGPGVLKRVGERPEVNRPPETVRDWVRIARQRGFLTATKAGRKGAGPGPRLLEDGDQE